VPPSPEVMSWKLITDPSAMTRQSARIVRITGECPGPIADDTVTVLASHRVVTRPAPLEGHCGSKD